MKDPAPIGLPESGAPAGAASKGKGTSRRREDLLLASTAGLLTGLAAVLGLELWRADLSVPLLYEGSDGMTNLALVKGLAEHGWFLVNPSLGAPFGQQLYDFPVFSTESLHLILIRVLSLGSRNPALLVNSYFLLGFPLSAVSALLVFRRFGAGPGPSVVCAVLFALLPAHFFRGEGHLFLAAYWTIPVSGYLVLAVYGGHRLFERQQREGAIARYFLSRATVVTLLLAALVGASDVYYAVFTILLVLVAGATTAGVRRSARPLATSGVVAALILAVLALTLTPTLVYRFDHGPNPATAKRSPGETDLYALNLSQLVLPVPGHRLNVLANLRSRDFATRAVPGPYENTWSSLGIIGTLGFLWLLGLASLGVVGGRTWRAPSSVHRHAAAGVLSAFLLATTGGVATLIALLVTAQLHAWNRISVLIAFFALLAVSLLLTNWRRSLADRSHPQAVFVFALTGLLVLGFLDQTTEGFIPPYAKIRPSWDSDSGFIHGIERRLPRNSMVFELPYVRFPEGATQSQLGSYDEFRGYIHSHQLRWSFGATKGRPEADWQATVAGQPVPLLLRALAAAGFAGLYLDRAGYADLGSVTLGQMTAIVRSPALLSRDQRLAFVDLRPYARRVKAAYSPSRLRALREATLRPPLVLWASGFLDEQTDGTSVWRWAGHKARLDVYNPRRTVREAELSATLISGTPNPSYTRVGYSDGTTELLTVTTAGTLLTRHLVLRPGHNRIVLTSAAHETIVPGNGRRARVQVRNPMIVDAALIAPASRPI